MLRVAPRSTARSSLDLAEDEARYDDAIAPYVELEDDDEADRVKRKAAVATTRRA